MAIKRKAFADALAHMNSRPSGSTPLAPPPPKAQPKQVAMLYQPRPLQAELHRSLKRFNVLVTHRRFGKTVLALNQILGSALSSKPHAADRPHFAYIGPLRHQVKSIAWDRLKYYAGPFTIQSTINETELRLDLVNTARIQLFGSDNPDAARGLGLNGSVFDEFADMDPTMRTQVIGPALADRKGWEIIIGTPKGDNAFKDLYEHAIASAASDPNSPWFHRLIAASESQIIPEDELALLRAEMSDEEYAQEFECSFVAPVSGSYYGKDMEKARNDKPSRITTVPHEPGIPVHFAWDLGISDSMAIWMFQLIGREIHLIGYYENSGEGLEHYVNHLRTHPFAFGTSILPHDASVRELGTGRSRVEILRSLGVGQLTILPAQSIADGINAVRTILPRCWFDERATHVGRKALIGYKRQWDAKRRVFSTAPQHNWASNGADAFRYLALGLSRLGDRSPLALAGFGTRAKAASSVGIV